MQVSDVCLGPIDLLGKSTCSAGLRWQQRTGRQSAGAQLLLEAGVALAQVAVAGVAVAGVLKRMWIAKS